MSDWLTDEQIEQSRLLLRRRTKAIDWADLESLIAQAREANRLRAELTKYLEASVAGGTRWQIFKDILEPKP